MAMELTEEQAGSAAATLVRWALTNPHRTRPDTTYELTPEGDYRAWLDRLSTELAKDRTDVTRSARWRRA